jgi:hypothetical protein
VRKGDENVAAKASAFARTGWTPRARARRGRPPKSWRKAFLDALSKMANVRVACEIAGVSRATAYWTRGEVKQFARQWDEAIGGGVLSPRAGGMAAGSGWRGEACDSGWRT